MRAVRSTRATQAMKKTLLALLAGIVLGAGGLFLWVQARDARIANDAELAATQHERELSKLRRQLSEANSSAAALRQKFATAGLDAAPVLEDQLDIQRLLNDARPLIKSLTIMFGSERKKMAERLIKGMAEKLAEEMGLTEEQTADMIAHFLKLDDENFEKIKAMLDRQITILDVFSTMKDMNPAKSMDEYVVAKLTDDQKKAWDNRKLESRAEQIERTANRQLQRMEKLNLDEAQKDQVFDILVKKNPQYDSSLAVEGLSTDAAAFDAAKSEEEAIAAVLREDQMAEYQVMQERQNKERKRISDALGGFDPTQFLQGMSGMEAFGGGFGGRGGRGGRGR